MLEIIYSKEFRKNLETLCQNRKNLIPKIKDCLVDFHLHATKSVYYHRKMKGYQDIHELAIGGDVRIICTIQIHEGVAVLLNIGTHSILGTSGDKKKKIW